MRFKVANPSAGSSTDTGVIKAIPVSYAAPIIDITSDQLHKGEDDLCFSSSTFVNPNSLESASSELLSPLGSVDLHTPATNLKKKFDNLLDDSSPPPPAGRKRSNKALKK
ncbi:hypothetical protein RIF29_38687 [Crotalaria pallida]|uniref:Uncharacterized protein n=1 Tax=Crotalaria pallida TaxID=3830 RepID=A0AAN9DZR9_CROPI